jgi:protein-S-isoprenylcysteine O-methyltransferase Ste14
MLTFLGPQYIGLIFLLSEVLLTVTRRSGGTGRRHDRSTLGMLWVVILLSVAASLFVTARLAAAALPHRDLIRLVGAALFLAGLALRWWSIITLGRFFTVDVQIARDHEVVETGPFAVVRHPSYAGLLLAFVGFALSLANWAAAVILLVPIVVALSRRMNVEEQALTSALGERYRSYMQRTKRLIPGVY